MNDNKDKPDRQKPGTEKDDARVPEDRIGQEKGEEPNDKSKVPGPIYPL
jgi:hypothetical protein